MWRTLKKLKQMYYMTQLSRSLAYGHRIGHSTPQITCSSVFVAALVTIARKWEDPDEQTIGMFSLDFCEILFTGKENQLMNFTGK